MSTPSHAASIFDTDPPPSEARRSVRSKEAKFSTRYGHRHHTYDTEKAPYPLSYDKDVLGLDLLDHGFMLKIHPNVSYVDWKSEPPTHVLDLGCGTGAWIIDAAKQWSDCQFVGFDLVDIQPPPSYLDRSITRRIRWLHGNFLTNKLPFDDDEFDLVRLRCISKGVPEHKWPALFEDIHRVLCPGGIMECTEEDIRFPTLPRWFTAPLRARSRRAASTLLPDGTQQSTPPPSSHKDGLLHDHALLESLFYSVFESRFINTRPTAILPALASAVFRHVRVAPVYNMKMPPFAPLMPFPESDSDLLPPPTPSIPADILSQQSIKFSPIRFTSFDVPAINPDSSSVVLDASSNGKSPSGSSADPDSSPDTKQMKATSSQLNISYAPPEETTSVDFKPGINAIEIPMDELTALAPETMATHLYRAYCGVLACQEAMWDQLKERVKEEKKLEELKALGWDDDDEFKKLEPRKKFELLTERYREDMHYRVALWYSLTKLGWELPPQGPLTKAEIQEEERLRKAMTEARKFASEEDVQTPCRSIRIILGIKGP